MAIHINHKVNISMYSLKREVNVKVTKFCVGRKELINVYKLTEFDLCIMYALWGTKLNATVDARQTVFSNS